MPFFCCVYFSSSSFHILKKRERERKHLNRERAVGNPMGTMLCNEVVENTKTSRCFKAHVVIGVTVSVGLLALWTFVSLFMNQWPWFIYPAGVFLITISFHHLIVSREKKCTLTFHMILYGTLNSIVFITWLCSTILVNQSNYSVWFIYFLFGTSIPLAIHFILEKYPTSPRK